MSKFIISKETSPFVFIPDTKGGKWEERKRVTMPIGQTIDGVFDKGFVVFPIGAEMWKVTASATKLSESPTNISNPLSCDGDAISMLEVSPEPEGFADNHIIHNIAPMVGCVPSGKFGADGYYNATGYSPKVSGKSFPMNADGYYSAVGNMGKYNPYVSGKSFPLNAEGFKPMVYLVADGKKTHSAQRQLRPCSSSLGNTPSGGTIDSGSYTCTCNDGHFDCKQKVQMSSSYIQAEGGTDNYYSADGKHPFQNFLDTLAPNRAAKGAAKASEQQSAADLNTAIANALNQQSAPSAERTTGGGMNTALIVGGAVVGVAILALVVYKMRKSA